MLTTRTLGADPVTLKGRGTQIFCIVYSYNQIAQIVCMTALLERISLCECSTTTALFSWD